MNKPHTGKNPTWGIVDRYIYYIEDVNHSVIVRGTPFPSQETGDRTEGAEGGAPVSTSGSSFFSTLSCLRSYFAACGYTYHMVHNTNVQHVFIQRYIQYSRTLASIIPRPQQRAVESREDGTRQTLFQLVPVAPGFSAQWRRSFRSVGHVAPCAPAGENRIRQRRRRRRPG